MQIILKRNPFYTQFYKEHQITYKDFYTVYTNICVRFEQTKNLPAKTEHLCYYLSLFHVSLFCYISISIHRNDRAAVSFHFQFCLFFHSLVFIYVIFHSRLLHLSIWKGFHFCTTLLPVHFILFISTFVGFFFSFAFHITKRASSFRFTCLWSIFFYYFALSDWFENKTTQTTISAHNFSHFFYSIHAFLFLTLVTLTLASLSFDTKHLDYYKHLHQQHKTQLDAIFVNFFGHLTHFSHIFRSS